MALVAFDLDDTLFKEEDYVFSAYRKISEYLSQNYSINNAFTILKDGFKAGKNPFGELFIQYPQLETHLDLLLEIYRTHLPDIKLDQTILSLLEEFKQFHTLALITDGRSNTQRHKIEALGLDKIIPNDNIIISEEFGSDKHNCANFEYFNKKYPHEKLFYYIGDNPKKDFEHPNKLGWTTICLKNDGRNIHSQIGDFLPIQLPQIYIQSLSELETII